MKQQLTIVFFLCFAFLATAQEQVINTPRFKGGFTLGFNASQINGDGLAGYNRLGLYGGITAAIMTESKFYYSTGITYSQRGSSPSISGSGGKIQFNLIEVPVIVHYMDKETEAGFYRIHFGGGFCYSRLISSKAVGNVWQGNEDAFKLNNINWLLEAMVYKNEHFSLGIRYNRALNHIYTRPVGTSKPLAVFTEHWITFKSMYYF